MTARFRPFSQSRLPALLLALMMAAYAGYFSWYTINRHNTLNSYAADLSLIDQPMWNTARGPGGFMELTWGDHQQPRLAEHLEPLLVPLSALFFVWDDVRVLLVAQSVALALGALPVFWLARQQLAAHSAVAAMSPWAALAFAAAYLLYPHLQAANIADFHADPFVVAPLLFAFWYGLNRRWGWMWLWAALAMLTKETLPTLTAMLGLWLLLHGWLNRKQTGGNLPRATLIHGAALVAVSAVWFFIATFLIVGPLARQYFGTDGPIYLASRFAEPPSLTAQLADIARWRYLWGLFAAAGFLPLLAPDVLLVGLPVLAANLLSSFPGQYSGEQHYSAPLVAVFSAAAIFGARRLIHHSSLREINGQTLKQSVLIGVTLWLLAWSLGYHARHGWTPLSVRAEQYAMSPAAERLPGLLAQIPAGAVVSASAGVHPHLTHRQKIYVFPTVQDADYLLVDVTDIPGVHPNDARARLLELLSADWQTLAATDGLLLAQKTGGQNSGGLPDAFFKFTTSASPPDIPLEVEFGGGSLQLLGVDMLDDPDDGVIFRFYWRAADPLPADLRLWPLVFDDWGRLLNNPAQVPMVAAVWYPPERWPAGQIIVTETLPQLLPDTFHLGLAAGVGSESLTQTERRWPASAAAPAAVRSGNWVQLASFQRQAYQPVQLPPTYSLQQLSTAAAQFGPAIQLNGFAATPESPQAGGALDVLLAWSALRPPAGDFTVFVHLLAPDGALAAQNDGIPTWLGPQPTSGWPAGQLLFDRHTLELPPTLPPGNYSLAVGLYNPQTLERLPLPDGRDSLPLAEVNIR